MGISVGEFEGDGLVAATVGLGALGLLQPIAISDSKNAEAQKRLRTLLTF
jgi:hypothetical protein